MQQIEMAEGGEEKYAYDYVGHVTSTMDANGGVITYQYDRERRMVLHVDWNGNQVQITYNVDGKNN